MDIKVDQFGSPDVGVCNATYLMILLNNQLSKWANGQRINTTKSQLRFILSIESDQLSDVQLSLSYETNGKEEIIPAGYVGQRLSSKEAKFCTKLPYFTIWDLRNKPPYSVIIEKFKNLDDTTGIVEAVADGYHSIMVDSCNIAPGINASLATANGNAILFLRSQQLYVTKIELYVKDIMMFIKQIEERRTIEIRDQVKSILTKEKK